MILDLFVSLEETKRGLLYHRIIIDVQKEELLLRFEKVTTSTSIIYKKQLIPIRVLQNYDQISIAAIRLIQEAMERSGEVMAHGKPKDL